MILLHRCLESKNIIFTYGDSKNHLWLLYTACNIGTIRTVARIKMWMNMLVNNAMQF
jgi:hypothetical protein